MKQACVFTEYQLEYYCCSISARLFRCTLIKSLSVAKENVPLIYYYQSNCKPTMTSLSENAARIVELKVIFIPSSSM